MIEVRPFNGLGHFETDWLSARHHFSFGHYMDHERMGVGPLRVWNDDTIQPKTGFPPHPHQDMEIITYVRKGAITHKDNLGNEGRTVAGDVQVMSAGTGIQHAEYNMEDEETQIFQIWIIPNKRGLAPRWDTKTFPKAGEAQGLQILASGRQEDEGSDALGIHQDAAVLGATLTEGESVDFALNGDRKAYLVPARGVIEVNGTRVDTRAGVVIHGEPNVTVKALEEAEIVVVDIP